MSFCLDFGAAVGLRQRIGGAPDGATSPGCMLYMCPAQVQQATIRAGLQHLQHPPKCLVLQPLKGRFPREKSPAQHRNTCNTEKRLKAQKQGSSMSGWPAFDVDKS